MAAMPGVLADVQCLRPSEQSSLPFIEKAKEQDEPRFHRMRQHRLRHAPHSDRRDPGSRGDLPPPLSRLEGEADEHPTDPLALDHLPVPQRERCPCA